MLINLFDTAVDSDNLGDHFIMEAVCQVVEALFPGATFIRTPTHRRARWPELGASRRAAFSIVGGTNILKSHMWMRGNWRLTPLDYLMRRDVVLLGIGWQQYGDDADLLSRLFFRNVLSKTLLHSVRDMHSFEMLQRHVPNVLYTACPTMWMLDQRRCQAIPVRKARDAIFAVTYYRPAPRMDRHLFELLKRHYDKVYFWPQQRGDIAYLSEIGVTDCVPITPDIKVYDRLLREEDVDFVGARLHGGIRALQLGRRALVIPVDNRAAEIGVCTALPVAPRCDLDAVERWIVNPVPTAITLPEDAIRRWKGQFDHTAMPLAMAER